MKFGPLGLALSFSFDYINACVLSFIISFFDEAIKIIFVEGSRLTESSHMMKLSHWGTIWNRRLPSEMPRCWSLVHYGYFHVEFGNKATQWQDFSLQVCLFDFFRWLGGFLFGTQHAHSISVFNGGITFKKNQDSTSSLEFFIFSWSRILTLSKMKVCSWTEVEETEPFLWLVCFCVFPRKSFCHFDLRLCRHPFCLQFSTALLP